MLSFTLDQASFPLRSNSTTNIQGVIQIESTSLCFMAPAWIQIQLVGREHTGNQSQIILNDTYHLSSHPNDWLPSLLVLAAVDRIENVYRFPFALIVPSHMPLSFQILDQEGYVVCGITYTLQVKVSSMDQTVILPIHFHRSSSKHKEEEGEENIPKKVFWGITKQAKQRWQYELEFPSAFDLATTTSGSISVRLRSLSDQKMEGKDDCCLIGCQLIQSVHSEGYQSHEVLATKTKLLKNPNKTWFQSCQVDFDLDNEPLPTVVNKRLGVKHYIRISVVFCGVAISVGESDCNMDLQFPVMFTGYSYPKYDDCKNRKRPVSSISTQSSLDEVSIQDKTIDLPFVSKYFINSPLKHV